MAPLAPITCSPVRRRAGPRATGDRRSPTTRTAMARPTRSMGARTCRTRRRRHRQAAFPTTRLGSTISHRGGVRELRNGVPSMSMSRAHRHRGPRDHVRDDIEIPRSSENSHRYSSISPHRHPTRPACPQIEPHSSHLTRAPQLLVLDRRRLERGLAVLHVDREPDLLQPVFDIRSSRFLTSFSVNFW